MRLGADLLLRMSNAERLVQYRIKLDLAAPPVVVVLAVLAAHEEPAVVDLAARSHDRHAGALRHADASLLVVRQLVPLVDRELREAHADPTRHLGIVRARPHLIAKLLIAEQARSGDFSVA